MTAPLDQALAQIRPDVRAAHAYVVQPSAGQLKLDAMENPYRLPPALQRELGERLGALALNRSPAERTAELARALARHAGVADDCGVTLGNGSDELIGLLTIAVAQPGACVLAPVPGFVMYEALARQQRLGFIGVPLRADDFQLDDNHCTDIDNDFKLDNNNGANDNDDVKLDDHGANDNDDFKLDDNH